MPPPDDLLDLQSRLVLDVLHDTEATATRFLRLYTGVFNRLSHDWLALLEEIEEKRETDAELDILLFRQERIRALRVQTAAQVTRFAREAELAVTAEQRMAVDVGAIHAARMMAEAVALSAPGIEVSFAKLPAGALRELVGRFDNGEPLRNLFDQLGADAATKAENVLFNGLATGQSPRMIARQLRTELSVPLTRALTISRTTMLGAYRSAALSTYAENSDIVKGWRWGASLGPRCCSACVALHGTFHPLSERFMHNHPSCRCSPIPETKTFAELGLNVAEPRRDLTTGPEWFDDQSAETQERILGPRKYDLFRAGRLDIQDTVYEDFSPRWGPSFREGSINYALAVHGAPKVWEVYG